jgi:hypothetical protein
MEFVYYERLCMVNVETEIKSKREYVSEGVIVNNNYVTCGDSYFFFVILGICIIKKCELYLLQQRDYQCPLSQVKKLFPVCRIHCLLYLEQVNL